MPCHCKFGPHISVKSTIYETLKSLPEECKCCQIFIGNPQSYITRKISKEDAEMSREHLSQHDRTLYVHANYLINLAREGDEGIVTKSRTCLQNTIDELYKIGPEYTGTVFHCGARGSVNRLCEELNDMNLKIPVYAENAAGEGTKIGSTFDDLRKIYEGTDSHNLRLCIDTCHAFAAGWVDFSEDAPTERFFEEMTAFEDRGWIFHVNDSLTPFSGKVDRHAPIGYGHIFNINKPSSVERIVRFYEMASSGRKDMIFETPNPVTSQLETDILLKIK